MVAGSAVRAFVVGEQRLVAALGARLDPVADKILLSPACSSVSLAEAPVAEWNSTGSIARRGPSRGASNR